MGVTLEQVKRKLQYTKVVQIRRPVEYSRRSAKLTIFSAIPEDDMLPSVDIHFNETCDIVDIVSFGHWHGHYDTAGDEDENIRRAFAVAREIVKGKVHIIEQFSCSGEYLGSDGYRPGQPLPHRLRDADYALRMIFGKLRQRLMLPVGPDA